MFLMALNKKGFVHQVAHEGDENILRIDFETTPFFPSLEDNPIVMSITIDLLASNPGITKIVFRQKRDYEYDREQTEMLAELARLYNKFLGQRQLIGYQAMGYGSLSEQL